MNTKAKIEQSIVENTDWAFEFRKEMHKNVYEEALTLACTPELTVMIYRNDEVGIWQWSISVVTPEKQCGFWMASFKKKKDAVALCKKMGWHTVK